MRFALALATLLVGLTFSSFAARHGAQDILVQQPWARELPPVARTGAVYLGLHNTGDTPDRLVSAVSAVAERVEIHTHEHHGGMMHMRQIDAVDLPAGTQVRFAPGGLHLMLIGLQQPLIAGHSFALTLRFEHAGSVQVQVEVRKDEPPAPAGHTGHGRAHH